jgi:hypothetical protein
MGVRLHVVVEGQTEETYVNRVLVPHLAGFEVWADVRAVETGRRRGLIFRGGLREYGKLRGDLVRWMKQDDHPEVHFTTMIDLYGLAALADPFPGWESTRAIRDPYRKAATLEAAWAGDIGHGRFVPYLQVHEFEALLLASPRHLEVEFVGRSHAIRRLEAMVAEFDSPELIDEGRETCPSKRIIAQLPEYEGLKASAGPIVAAKIGLEFLRSRCRHFNEWLSTLENLGAQTRP